MFFTLNVALSPVALAAAVTVEGTGTIERLTGGGVTVTGSVPLDCLFA
jgi:hypothetical protein